MTFFFSHVSRSTCAAKVPFVEGEVYTCGSAGCREDLVHVFVFMHGLEASWSLVFFDLLICFYLLSEGVFVLLWQCLHLVLVKCEFCPSTIKSSIFIIINWLPASILCNGEF